MPEKPTVATQTIDGVHTWVVNPDTVPIAWDSTIASSLDRLRIQIGEEIGTSVPRIANALRTYGFALLQSLDQDAASLDARLHQLGSQLGTIVAQSPRGELIEDVRDMSDIDTEIDQRGYRSGGELVPHSDPPTLIVLHCVVAARSGGESYLVNVASIAQRMVASDRSAFAVLCETFPMWRVDGQSGRVAGPDHPRVPVFAVRDGKVSAMVYRPFIERAADALGEPLTAQQIGALDLFDMYTSDPTLTVRFMLAPGETLILHNRAVLHARTNYSDWPELHRRRHLKRLWIDAPALLPVDPAHELGDIFRPINER